MSDFPRVLYRPGSQEAPWGIPSDLLHVHDQDSMDTALGEGWGLVPVAAETAEPNDPNTPTKRGRPPKTEALP